MGRICVPLLPSLKMPISIILNTDYAAVPRYRGAVGHGHHNTTHAWLIICKYLGTEVRYGHHNDRGAVWTLILVWLLFPCWSGWCAQAGLADVPMLVWLMCPCRYREAVKHRSLLMKDQPISAKDLVAYWTEYVIRHQGAPHLRSPVLDMPWSVKANIPI